MALKQLLLGLEGESNAYPNHDTPSTAGGFNYGQSTSIFDTKTFNQKSFKFGQGTASDRPNGGFSNEPFVTNPTINLLAGNPGLETTINTFTDGLIRGGAITHAERLITDGERIGKFLISSKGLAFIVKQVGLQKTNPKISRPGKGISRANQRTYNLGINTLSSVVSAGTGLYVKREGLLPTSHTGYADAKGLFKDNNNNRLWNLFETHIERQTSTDSGRERGRFGQFLRNVGRKLKNFLVGGSDGELLYAYNGGPGSLFGIGRTQIRKYAPFSADSGEVNKISRDLLKNGYFEKNRFNITTEGYSYGVSNVFLRPRELRKLNRNGKFVFNTDLFEDIYESTGFGKGGTSNRRKYKNPEELASETTEPLKANKDSIREIVNKGKFTINQENLEEGDRRFRRRNKYLNKPSKFTLSDKIIEDDFLRMSSYSLFGALPSDVLRYETDKDILDPENRDKLRLKSEKVFSSFVNGEFDPTYFSKVNNFVPQMLFDPDASSLYIGYDYLNPSEHISTLETDLKSVDGQYNPEDKYLKIGFEDLFKRVIPNNFYSTLKGANADSYVDNFLGGSHTGIIHAEPSTSMLSRQYYLIGNVDKYEPFLFNIRNLRSPIFGFTPDMGAVLDTDLDFNEQQFSPEIKLKDAPIDVVFGRGSIKGIFNLTPENLGYNPYAYQNKIDNVGAAEIPFNIVSSNTALFVARSNNGGTFTDVNGDPQIKSAEFDTVPMNLNPFKGEDFDYRTAFGSPNYTILFRDVKDFRELKASRDNNQTYTDYQRLTNKGRSFYRETRVNLGNPGTKIHNKRGVNIGGKPTDNQSYAIYDESTIDKINALDIFDNQGTSYEGALARDLIRFRIEALDGDRPKHAKVMTFRAFLDDFGDNYTGNWNSFKYNGRGEEFYTYSGFDRKINFSFKIAAQSRHEMVPLFRKLNYLVSQTAPDYKGTRMRGNFVRLCIGSMIDRTPGFFTSVNLKWQKNYPWDIAISHLETKEDKDGMNVMPHVLDVSCQFTPIHNFIPKKSIQESPFILPHENNRKIYQDAQKWYSYGSAPSVDTAFGYHGKGDGTGKLFSGYQSQEQKRAAEKKAAEEKQRKEEEAERIRIQNEAAAAAAVERIRQRTSLSYNKSTLGNEDLVNKSNSSTDLLLTSTQRRLKILEIGAIVKNNKSGAGEGTVLKDTRTEEQKLQDATGIKLK